MLMASTYICRKGCVMLPLEAGGGEFTQPFLHILVVLFLGNPLG